MWQGYTDYPRTYLTAAERTHLRKDRFFRLRAPVRPFPRIGGGGGSASGGACQPGSFDGATSQAADISFATTCAGTAGTVSTLEVAQVTESCASSDAPVSIGPLQLGAQPLAADGSFAYSETVTPPQAGGAPVQVTVAAQITGIRASGTLDVRETSGANADCSAGGITWTAIRSS